MIYNETLNALSSDCKCGSCRVYIVLFAVFLTTRVIISSVFIYFHWYLKESDDQLYLKKMFVLNLNVRIEFNPITQTTIYMQIC